MSLIGLLVLPAMDLVGQSGNTGAGLGDSDDSQMAASTSADDAVSPSREQAAYIAQNLELYELDAKYYDSILEGRIPGVSFKIKNNGNRTLKKVGVRVVFFDANGQPIAEENYFPILVSEYSFGESNKPLSPNYIPQQERGHFWSATSVPTEWQTGKATATITEIEFGPDETAPPVG